MGIILVGDKGVNALALLDFAHVFARNSPCKKSQCGVVLDIPHESFFSGWDHPPQGVPCDLELLCGSVHCRDYTIHAEADALLKALALDNDPTGGIMYHMTVKHGIGVPTGGPSCLPCATLVKQYSLRFVLFEERRGKGVPVLYDPHEFYWLSRLAHGRS